MPDVIITPGTGRIDWYDSGGTPQNLRIDGNTQNVISFVGDGSAGGTPNTALVSINDSLTGTINPGTTGMGFGTSSLRWLVFSGALDISNTNNALASAASVYTPSTYAIGVSTPHIITISGAGDVGGASDVRGLGISLTSTGTAGITSLSGLRINNDVNGTAGTVSLSTGIVITPRLLNAATLTGLRGISIAATLSGTGTVGTYRALEIVAPTLSSTGTISTSHGIYIQNQGNTLASTAYAIGIADQTGSTNTYAFNFEGTSGLSKQGLWWNLDTNLYRSAFNTLKTDDNLIVGINLAVTGMSSVGIVHTDASGNLTTSALLPADFGSQSANFVLIAPNGSAGAPTFRLLLAADLPASVVSASPGTSGNLLMSNGSVWTSTQSLTGSYTMTGSNTALLSVACTPNNGTSAGATMVVTLSPTNNAITTSSLFALDGQFTYAINAGNAGSSSLLCGVRGRAKHSSTTSGTVNNITGVLSEYEKTGTLSIVTGAYGFRARQTGVHAGTTANYYGVFIESNYAAATFTGVSYGMYLQKVGPLGSTANSANIFMESDGTVKTGIAWGISANTIDTTLYRSAAGIITTDGSAVIGTNLAVTGMNSVGIVHTDVSGNLTTSALVTADLPAVAGVSGSYTNANLTVDGTGRITAASNGAGGTSFTWSTIIGATTALVNNGYICNNTSQITVTLPTTAAAGSIIEIVGLGTGGWKVAQNASQIINMGNVASTSGVTGSISFTQRYDAVKMLCVIANTTWNVITSHGNITLA